MTFYWLFLLFTLTVMFCQQKIFRQSLVYIKFKILLIFYVLCIQTCHQRLKKQYYLLLSIKIEKVNKKLTLKPILITLYFDN